MFGNPKWFKRRKYTGWGVSPSRKEGWYYLVFIALSVLTLSFFLKKSPLSQDWQLALLISYLSVFLIDLISIAIRIEKDERDKKHEAFAERNVAWFMVAVLSAGIIYQGVQSALMASFQVDPFLLVPLLGGLCVKAFSNWYLIDK